RAGRAASAGRAPAGARAGGARARLAPAARAVGRAEVPIRAHAARARRCAVSGRADWQTPPALFERLNLMFRFDYDAFAAHENALLPTYSTPEGTFRRERDCEKCQIGGYHE